MLLTNKEKLLEKINYIDRQKAQLGVSLFDEKDKIILEEIYDTMIDVLFKYADITIIDNKKSFSIIETYEPTGMFLIDPKKNKLPYWTAIDNTSGEAFTEDFTSKILAIRWLLDKDIEFK